MRPTVEALWNGNLSFAENCGAGIPEIENLVMLMERNKENLNKELGEHQKESFQKYIDCTEEYIWLLSTQAFSDGFCLGGRLFCETLLSE